MARPSAPNAKPKRKSPPHGGTTNIRLPSEIRSVLRARLGDDAPAVEAQMQEMLSEARALQAANAGKAKAGPPRGEVTRSSEEAPAGYSPFSLAPIGVFNPSAISIATMNEMMQDGMVSFILDVRAMPIIALFRKEPGQGWDVECDNAELA